MEDSNIIRVEQEKMAEIMLSLFDFIYSNEEKYIFFSDRICESFNIPKRIDGMPESFKEKYIHPDYHKAFDEAFAKSDSGERKVEVELRDRDSIHWFRLILETAEKTPDGKARFSVGMFESTDELHTIKGRASMMTEISKIAIRDHYLRVFMLDLQSGRYSYFNQDADSESAWVSRDYDNTFDEYVEDYTRFANLEEDRKKILQLKTAELQKSLEQNGGRTDIRYCTNVNGRCTWYLVECSYFNDDKNTILGLISDVTEEENKKHQLENALIMAEDANRAKSSFLANMSHEIRTPMNAIIGISEILLSKNLPTGIKDDVLTIQNAGNGLLAIINDILDFSKIESGKFEIIPVDYMLPSLLMDISNMISVRVSDKPVYFLMNVDSCLPAHLIGDDIRIRQILMNLLGNSVKFTKEGHISLDVEGEKTGDSTWKLVFKVTDTGIGIKEEDIGKLFGTFSQVDTKKNRAVTGSGLGLAISKSFAEMMGGSITVASEYGRGSVFTVTVYQEVKKYEPLGRVNDSGLKHVLICEDDDVLISTLGRSLENLEVSYRICSDYGRIKTFSDATHAVIRRKNFASVRDVLTFMFKPENIYLILENGEHALEEYMDYKQIQLPLAGLQFVSAFNNKEIVSGYKKHGFDRTRIVPLEFARVLVVDDNETNLSVAKGLLLPYKMTVDTAESGYKAIELLKTVKYDLIFMDHMMPEMDGVETTAYIRKMDGDFYRNVPIVALTANAISEAKDMFLSSGFNDFISKPIEMSELNRVLKTFVQPKAPAGYLVRVAREKHDNVPGEPAPVITADSSLRDVLLRNNELLEENLKLLSSLINGKVSVVENMTAENGEAGSYREAGLYMEAADTAGLSGESRLLEIPRINTERALELYGNDAAVYGSVLKTFYKDLCEKSILLPKLSAAEDIKNLTIAVHAVKGASAGVGADVLSGLAKDLESAGREENMNLVRALFNGFMEELNTTKDILAEHLGVTEAQTEDAPDRETRDGFDRADTDALKEACEDMDYEAAGEILKRMSQFTYPAALNEILSSMIKYCDEFEYDKLEELAGEI